MSTADGGSIIEAALAHLGERQTEVHLSPAVTCDFWRYCVRSTEAALLLLFLPGYRIYGKTVFAWPRAYHAEWHRLYRNGEEGGRFEDRGH